MYTSELWEFSIFTSKNMQINHKHLFNIEKDWIEII